MIKTKILVLLISGSTLIGGFSLFHKGLQTTPNQSLTPQVESSNSKNTDSNANSNADSNINTNTSPTSNAIDNSVDKTIDKVDTKSTPQSKNTDSSPTNNTKNTVPRQEESSSKNIAKETPQTPKQEDAPKAPVSQEKTAPKKASTPAKENPNQTKENSSQTDVSSQIQSIIFSKVNKERANAGVKPLAYSTSMQNFAIKKSKDMAVNNYFSHEDLSGNLESTYIKQAGINFSAWGENIAYVDGISGAENIANTIMTNWMNSPGHKANILSTKYTQIGVGVYKIGNKYYATQEFLTP